MSALRNPELYHPSTSRDPIKASSKLKRSGGTFPSGAEAPTALHCLQVVGTWVNPAQKKKVLIFNPTAGKTRAVIAGRQAFPIYLNFLFTESRPSLPISLPMHPFTRCLLINKCL